MIDAANLQHRARKRFGQNFLHDRRVIERIVDAIEPQPEQAIVEIGPGQAALTRELVRRAGHITAIEIDRDLAGWLREQFTPDELTLIEADALKLDWASLAARPLRVVGNQLAVTVAPKGIVAFAIPATVKPSLQARLYDTTIPPLDASSVPTRWPLATIGTPRASWLEGNWPLDSPAESATTSPFASATMMRRPTPP